MDASICAAKVKTLLPGSSNLEKPWWIVIQDARRDSKCRAA